MDVDKRVGASRGIILSLVVVGIPMFAWLVSFPMNDRPPSEAVALTLAKIGGFGGMALFAWSLVLSGRWRIFDTLFGGQDKAYVAHRFFASLAVALLIVHPIALFIARSVRFTAGEAFIRTFNIGDIGILLGVISLYALVWLLIWSITTKVKHETFVRVHRLLGLVFIIGAAHALLSGSVLASNSFMWWYMAGLSTLAVASFAHYSLLGDFLHPHYAYRIVATRRHRGDIMEITLRPAHRHLAFTPGQFAYLAFDRLFNNEYHPYTIASGQRASYLQFYIKMSGDYTRELIRLKPGDKARVKGPYGGFTFRDRKHHKQLWIAGGIGITPFLSKARSLPKARRWPRIELIYVVRTVGDAFAARELNRIEHQTASFNYTLLHANRYGTTSLYDLAEHFTDLRDYAIYICGPPAMIKAYEAQARRLGIAEQLHFEEFQF